MRTRAVTIATMMLLVDLGWAVPSLTIAYHRDDHAAALSDACLYLKAFGANSG